MNDFICEIQADDLIHGDDFLHIHGDDFLQWVAQCEWEESQKDDEDRRWDNIREEINSEFADNQPKPF
jgi:hypothetical protein